MPFIVYFFLSLLIIYIPTPTLLLFFQKLASQHDNLTAFSKLFLFLMVLLDYYLSYYWLKNCKVKSSLPLFSLCQCLRMADPLLSLFTI